MTTIRTMSMEGEETVDRHTSAIACISTKDRATAIKILRDSKHLLATHGWAKEKYETANGCLCLTGAIHKAAGFTPGGHCGHDNFEIFEKYDKPNSIGYEGIFRDCEHTSKARQTILAMSAIVIGLGNDCKYSSHGICIDFNDDHETDYEAVKRAIDLGIMVLAK